jgi:DNA adenine methylase
MTTVLRYPGGKARAVKTLLSYIPDDVTVVVSPFFGGGAFELALAQMRNCRIIANDKFEPLYNFWITLKNNRDDLVSEVVKLMPVTKDMFNECRANVVNLELNAVSRAACYFALNRSSFSGATLSGGFSAESARTRFTQSSVERLKKIDLGNIEFHNMDCIPFIEQYSSQGYMYLDPPYMLEGNGNKLYGKQGDMHETFQHNKLFEVLHGKTSWTMSYNDAPALRDMYKNYKIEEAEWAYGMNKTKRSSEVVIQPL